MVMGQLELEADIAVIGGGPGGYVAAIRAADLGFEVILIEKSERLGGVCLTEGCIPSKTLIHAVELADSARDAGRFGLNFSDIQIDREKLLAWTESVINDLTRGIDTLLSKRGVEVIHGTARFKNNSHLLVEPSTSVKFKNAIIATGSSINKLPGNYDLPLWTSADALKIPEIPETLLVVGGGYIGMEMGLVYSGLGSRVTMVEFLPDLLAGADQDLVRVVVKRMKSKFENVMTGSKVTAIQKTPDGKKYSVTIQDGDSTRTMEFDRVLAAVGRRPNSDDLGLENTKIKPDEKGFIPTNEECRTVEKNIFAVGDVTHGPMLAHKASREGKVAAEVIAELPSALDNRAIPAVVFTDPEIAWSGLTEREAGEKGIAVNVGKFPLTALGRARSLGRTEGFVKILADPDSNLILGVGIVGSQASELISEGTLAIEMGATLEDLLVTIHPHPTLSESIMEAAEAAAGTPIHTFPKKEKY